MNPIHTAVSSRPYYSYQELSASDRTLHEQESILLTPQPVVEKLDSSKNDEKKSLLNQSLAKGLSKEKNSHSTRSENKEIEFFPESSPKGGFDPNAYWNKMYQLILQGILEVRKETHGEEELLLKLVKHMLEIAVLLSARLWNQSVEIVIVGKSVLISMKKIHHEKICPC